MFAGERQQQRQQPATAAVLSGEPLKSTAAQTRAQALTATLPPASRAHKLVKAPRQPENPWQFHAWWSVLPACSVTRIMQRLVQRRRWRQQAHTPRRPAACSSTTHAPCHLQSPQPAACAGLRRPAYRVLSGSPARPAQTPQRRPIHLMLTARVRPALPRGRDGDGGGGMAVLATEAWLWPRSTNLHELRRQVEQKAGPVVVTHQDVTWMPAQHPC